MAIGRDVFDVFARKDTREQVSILRRVGLDTDLADALLGKVAGMYPERFSALTVALNRAGA